MSPSSVSPLSNPFSTWPYEEYSRKMDLITSLSHLKTLTSSLFSLEKCSWILMPCSHPLLHHVTASWVSSILLLHPLTVSAPVTLNHFQVRNYTVLFPACVSMLALPSLAGIFSLLSCMSGELLSQDTPSLRSYFKPLEFQSFHGLLLY